MTLTIIELIIIVCVCFGLGALFSDNEFLGAGAIIVCFAAVIAWLTIFFVNKEDLKHEKIISRDQITEEAQ
jgi:hypothetical protein